MFLEAAAVMKPFIGTYENKVDRKGRVSVPAKFRAVLQAAEYTTIVVRPDRERGCIEGYGMDRLERLSEATPDLLDEGTQTPSLERIYDILSDSEELPFDPTGRVVVPADLLAQAGIGETAVFVGLGRVFQIWNPTALEASRGRKPRASASQGAGA
ncbi:division/cell wall cluster transcriptional repressor MraZ [Rhodospirillum rubrum]|uniref:Transcriptional regulator MraZ n=1 Tax=Rhodospirillum rubrum (strain ATCC 11170 / ATH 1.1.1 / DSM 467 / LMG 4362 / NCIMB 8255 / S1) TaxID=269796 RepID=MRAZ_RHORT|nr:transcriptional regulator MraZ [Rhodospirillum rubrum]Q2RVT5.1 RecName: Full=Transcriptional regulator MraZ [Rhodospirillum rubrum ATCC 11170]ABC21760.1 MraZ protein [Rhodospirillum rubrum ATCC 11170]AEO47458.1 MraZ protein [Rhodospirillum rubrum F11]MBK5953317.1 transcriptional regulator MraZ [Rhodospirillum rubrum]QXG81422.1 transcriptional regulator MraZ [Rhodospirillum rubrum]HCF19079.1 transcriptional regulator MraZ [Rhodospirillum rubrum]